MATKKDLFSNLPIPMEGSKILLLTHTDLDGSGPVAVMNSLFSDVTVRHCTNGEMSNAIKNSVCDDEISSMYDFIIACDISCSLEDAAIIDESPNKTKLVILDHHLTAQDLNKYSFACVVPELPEDSSISRFYPNPSVAHSSGTSVLYDYLSFNGLTRNAPSIINLDKLVHRIAAYDTWDWVNIYQKNGMNDIAKECDDLNTLFGCYGMAMFDETFSARMKETTLQPLFNDMDNTLLRIEANKIQTHLMGVSKLCQTGQMKFEDRTYNVVVANTNNFLKHTFEKMGELYPQADILMVNYGTGVSFRSSKPDVDISKIVGALGGGGHKGAGGVRISKDKQIAYLESALNTNFIPMSFDDLQKTTPVIEAPVESPKRELSVCVLLQASKKTGKVTQVITALGSAQLEGYGLMNTPSSKETYVFERESGKMLAKYTGTSDGFPKVEKKENLGTCEDIGIALSDLRAIKDERFDKPETPNNPNKNGLTDI